MERQKVGGWMMGHIGYFLPSRDRASISGGMNCMPDTSMFMKSDLCLTPAGGTQSTSLPGRSILPVMALRMRRERAVWTLQALMSTALPHWTQAGGVVA